MTEKTYPEWRRLADSTVLPAQLFIDGAYCAAEGDAIFAKRNPATGAVLGQVARGRMWTAPCAPPAPPMRMAAGAARAWPRGGTYC